MYLRCTGWCFDAHCKNKLINIPPHIVLWGCGKTLRPTTSKYSLYNIYFNSIYSFFKYIVYTLGILFLTEVTMLYIRSPELVFHN